MVLVKYNNKTTTKDKDFISACGFSIYENKKDFENDFRAFVTLKCYLNPNTTLENVLATDKGLYIHPGLYYKSIADLYDDFTIEYIDAQTAKAINDCFGSVWGNWFI